MPPVARPAVPFAVIVMGVSGCGKSTLGALIAEALGCPFLEGDDYHSRAAVEKMRAGEPLRDEDRWPWIERIGAATAEAVAAQGAAVTACSALRRCYRERLSAAIGHPLELILLDNSRERLIERMTTRVAHFMPVGLLDSQLATLERPHPDEDALTLVTEHPAGLLLDHVLARLDERRRIIC